MTLKNIRTPLVTAFLCLFMVAGAAAQADTAPAEWWWAISPGAAIPLGLNAGYVSTGGVLDFSVEYLNPALGGLSFILGASAGYLPVSVSGVGGIIEAAPSAGAAFQLPLPFVPRLTGRVFSTVGYSYIGFYEHVASPYVWYGGDPFAEAGVGLAYALSPSLSLRFATSYAYFYQLYGRLTVSAGIAFTSARPQAGGPPLPERPRLLRLDEIKLQSLFPVFHAFYDDHAVGTVLIRNTGARPLTNIGVSFLVKDYMDGPKQCASIAALGPGETRQVPLYALLNSAILGVTEPTKVTAVIDAVYQTGDGTQEHSGTTATLGIYDRNAMTWDDDRKAAAFVSAKDPWVLLLSNNVTAMVKDLRNPGVNRNLQTAIAFHDALRVYGLAYSPNPSTPYSYTSAHPEIVDFLKFPRQTLAYRAGDCSDLSILYASFFESVGIETAFITVPGHIFMAINLDVTPEQARGLPGADDLIVRDGKVWLPIETTMRDKGLLDAWKEAAREWRQGQADNDAAFYPVRDAWKVYAPVGLAADATSPQLPAQDLVQLAFSAELSRRVDDELSVALAPLNARVQQRASPRALNSRGVAYARYGRLDRAESDFNAALQAQGDYVYALVNLGTVSLLRSDNQGAYEYFRRAVQAAPRDPRALLALAAAASALGKTEEAGQALASARKADPQLAERYGQPGEPTGEGTRAAAPVAVPEWREE